MESLLSELGHDARSAETRIGRRPLQAARPGRLRRAWRTCGAPRTRCSTAAWRSSSCTSGSRRTSSSSSGSAARPPSAAGLQHPNVVGVFDRGSYEGAHYIAMEYVEGASLKDLIERGLSVGEAVEIVRQVLAGAKYAHAHGIIHRDLKPQNVLVDARGPRPGDRLRDRPRGRLGDHADGLGARHRPVPLARAGAGAAESPPTSDIYSIGVMLYEALTGQVPFEGDIAGRGGAEAGLRASAAAERAEPAGLAGPRRGRAEGARQGPGEPLRLRRGVRAGARRGRGGPLRRGARRDTASYAAVAAAAGAPPRRAARGSATVRTRLLHPGAARDPRGPAAGDRAVLVYFADAAGDGAGADGDQQDAGAGRGDPGRCRIRGGGHLRAQRQPARDGDGAGSAGRLECRTGLDRDDHRLQRPRAPWWCPTSPAKPGSRRSRRSRAGPSPEGRRVASSRRRPAWRSARSPPPETSWDEERRSCSRSRAGRRRSRCPR